MYLVGTLCVVGLVILFIYKKRRSTLIRKGITKREENLPAFAKSANDGDDLTDWEVSHLKMNICPDCLGSDGFFEGPHGGVSVNFKCANPKCGSRFNGLESLEFVDRISEPSPDKQKKVTS